MMLLSEKITVIKLLAVDLDGTCLNWSNKILSETMEALKKASNIGLEIVFLTGRSYVSLPHQLKKESFYKYCIFSNGATIYDRNEEKIIYHNYMSSDIALEVLQQAKKYKLGLTVHIDNKYVVQDKKILLIGKFLYGKDFKDVIKTKDIINYVRENGGRVEELHIFYFKKSNGQKVEKLRKSYTYLYSFKNHFCLEMVAEGTSKGNALEWLYKKLGYKKEEVACVGDGENDISVFEKSGLKFAVRNAIENLKSLADYVVESNNRNGVAAVVERILECGKTD